MKGNGIPSTMEAIRLHRAGDPDALTHERIETPSARAGEALVRVHAAAITRDELEWPADRLPATPSYELSGVVVAVGAGVDRAAVGEAVYGLTAFDGDGAAAEFVAVPADLLAPKPPTLGHVESAALPMGALTAWQGLIEHGALQAGQRVLVLGAGGGVGHLAVQIARARGADVIERFEDVAEPVDLVFDTAGGELLSRSGSVVREGGRIVCVAEEPPPGVDAVYFVVEPNRGQLEELTQLVERGDLRPAIDSVFPLAEAQAAFARTEERGKRGKVVLEVVG